MLSSNPRAPIGHNNPPGAIDLAKPGIADLEQFLKDNPVIGNDDEARAANTIISRTTLAFKGMEDERKSKVDPLNAQVKATNAEYHKWHNADRNNPGIWDKFVIELRSRLTKYAKVEEAKRREAAEAAQRAKDEAERLAREAEEREREAKETAAAGVCDVDIGTVTQEADEAFRDFQKADRISQRAEKARTVRIGGGFGKVSTLRTKEILSVSDWKAAVSAIEEMSDGLPATISDAILTCARAYRKITGELPPGIRAETERTL
jgi:hypothetical protein